MDFALCVDYTPVTNHGGRGGGGKKDGSGKKGGGCKKGGEFSANDCSKVAFKKLSLWERHE